MNPKDIGKISYVDSRVERVLGYNTAALAAGSIYKLIPKEIGLMHRDFFASYLATGKAFHVNRKSDLFLLDSNDCMIPVTMFMKNYFLYDQNSFAMITFFQKKDSSHDYLFANPSGKILSMSNSLEELLFIESQASSIPLYVQHIIPAIHPLILRLNETTDAQVVRREIDKMCSGKFFEKIELVINPDFSTKGLIQVLFNDLSLLKALNCQNSPESLNEYYARMNTTRNNNIQKFQTCVDLQVFQTPAGFYQMLKLSRVTPIQKDYPIREKKYLNIFRLSLLKIFLRSLHSLASKGLLHTLLHTPKKLEMINRFFNYSRKHEVASRDRSRVDRQLYLPTKAANRIRETMNIKYTIRKNLQLFRVCLIITVLFETLVFVALSTQFFAEYLNTFISLENSFSVSEKRNSIFNMVTLIPQMNYHRSIQPNSQGKVVFSSDFTFVPKTRSITASDLQLLYEIESRFQKTQLEHLLQKINSVTNLNLMTDSDDTPGLTSAFTPFFPSLNLNITANMHDMFVYFYYLANKAQIKFTDYQAFSVNAYKVSEEFGLEFERQVYMTQITKAIANLFFWNYICVGGIALLLICVVCLNSRNLIRLEGCYDYSRLISISQAKIAKITSFLQKYEFQGYLRLVPVKKRLAEIQKSDRFRASFLWIRLGTLVALLPLILILLAPLIAHININGYLQKIKIEGAESIVTSLLNLEFLVAKSVIGLQDSNYPRRTQIRIFRKKFMRFSNILFSIVSLRKVDMPELSTDTNLCESLQELKMANCSKVYQGVFVKGYKALCHLVLSELTNFFTNKVTLFQISRSEDFYQMVMGFLFTTRRFSEKVKASTKEDFQVFSKTYTSITACIAVGVFLIAAYFSRKYFLKLQLDWAAALSLLFYIKSKEAMFHSKLLKIFK